MLYKGRDLDYRGLWEALGVSIPDSDRGTFTRLLYCPHPEHDNKRSPAFQVNTRKPLVNCFNAGCFGSDGKPGTYEYAVQAIRECSQREAVKFILGFTRAGLGVEPETYGGRGERKTVTGDSALAREMEKLAQGEFTYLPTPARDYLDERGISTSSRGKWQIGWDEESERIVIPGFDDRGVLRFLIKRAIDGRRPKYLYTDGAVKTAILFGLLHVPRNQRILSLVEGSIDAIRLHELGEQTAVGILGSGLDLQQVRLIDRFGPERIYTFFDGDAAGVHNTLDAIQKLPRHSIFVCRFPKGVSDPAGLLHAQARRAFDTAIPAYEFLRIVNALTPTRSRRRKEHQVGSST